MGKRANDWDKHYTTEDVHAPRTDAETDSSVRRSMQRMARSMALGFSVLVIGIAYTVGSVSATGCEGRKDTAQTVSGILKRLDKANEIQFDKGKITYAERVTAETFYKGEQSRLEIPECKTLIF